VIAELVTFSVLWVWLAVMFLVGEEQHHRRLGARLMLLTPVWPVVVVVVVLRLLVVGVWSGVRWLWRAAEFGGRR